MKIMSYIWVTMIQFVTIVIVIKKKFKELMVICMMIGQVHNLYRKKQLNNFLILYLNIIYLVEI